MLITLEEALQRVTNVAATLSPVQGVQTVPLGAAVARVLAADVLADRDQPPFDRSTRDGFAVASRDLAARPRLPLRCVGELPAGRVYEGHIAAGTCVEIMTGAPLPAGADAVVMVEHCHRDGDDVIVDKPVAKGDNIVPQGAEALAGALVMASGGRLDAAAIALLASVGTVNVAVKNLPSTAVLTTGDEIVAAQERPAAHQIRNSNAYLLSAAIAQSGGAAVVVPPAVDEPHVLREALQAALAQDLVLITGGVSKGKHDYVKTVLADLQATVIFAGVSIRPGKPVVLAVVPWQGRQVPVLALPGNPLSALVTFLLFGRPLLRRLAGAAASSPGLVWLRVAQALPWKPLDFTAFVPARLAPDGLYTSLHILPSAGSGDLVAAAMADGFACIPAHANGPQAGDLIAFLPKP
ncbi:MAG: molybdopterin molybdotransferase MoeA [Deltaproteobacteria bacterium]|nr:molybdopterin molybdotransferase MoeA [Deltaproteobacteria bacterium]